MFPMTMLLRRSPLSNFLSMVFNLSLFLFVCYIISMFPEVTYSNSILILFSVKNSKGMVYLGLSNVDVLYCV